MRGCKATVLRFYGLKITKIIENQGFAHFPISEPETARIGHVEGSLGTQTQVSLCRKCLDTSTKTPRDVYEPVRGCEAAVLRFYGLENYRNRRKSLPGLWSARPGPPPVLVARPGPGRPQGGAGAGRGTPRCRGATRVPCLRSRERVESMRGAQGTYRADPRN